ncbi:MAG: sugar ABC transporter permease [Lachnospiraceae bacterium]|nr:sugar ABC transporter permease [Lachnospiraceae bacterium]
MKTNFFKSIKDEVSDFFGTFAKGDWKTRLSYVIMGAGNFLRGQIARGLVFLLFEVLFFVYIFNGLGGESGLYWLSMLPSLGLTGPGEVYDAFYDQYVYQYNDNSFQILLYGVLTIFLIVAFVITWRANIKQARIAQETVKRGGKLNKIKDDLKSLVDEGFYKTLLALPVVGIFTFTVLPIVFMILVAFTNYDGTHDGYVTNLFNWVGFENFFKLFEFNGSGNYGSVFVGILGWTIVWAFFATFSNYFLGILTALMINRKSIKFKKLWRTIFVLTIAIPQFISLLYVSKMFDKSGLINGFLVNSGILTTPYDFWGHAFSARLLVILINIWIGVPYLMLIATGILLNIPADLYEAARIDGANPRQQFFHITMPYMLFVTGPYLLTSFTGNMNNFNVIYLLSAGGPTNSAASSASGSVGYTDLLVTWLFKITTGAESQYYMASVIGIVIFVVVATITLIVYNLLPSNKNEGDFS